MTPREDDFYIGYEGPMPTSMALVVRRAVTVAAVLAIATAAAFTVAQRPLAVSWFAYDDVQPVEGWLSPTPVPSLLVPDEGRWTRFWLVAPGKLGAAHALGHPQEGWFRLRATRIDREPWHMLEVVPGSLTPSERPDAPPSPPTPQLHAGFRARGEIVDSKCFLGVMNPGERLVHRDCATRCLSGGVPAMFSYRDRDGRPHLALLLEPDGRPAASSRGREAGRPIELAGRLIVDGDDEMLVLADAF